MPPEVKTESVSIFDSPEVVVFEASAGSGKTYTLARRYIQLLFHPKVIDRSVPFRSILAITFTNKASFEMKIRILELLKKIALGKLSEREYAHILAPLGIEKEKIERRAFLLMDELIAHYNFFQVQTIDKFTNALLVGCAYKIGLTANFRIKTNTNQYLEYSLDQLIDKAPNDRHLKKIFENFLHNYLYLENRTGWFPKKDMLAIIKALFSHHNTYGLPLTSTEISSQDIIKAKNEFLRDLKTLRDHLPEKCDKRFANVLNSFLEKHSHGFDVDSLGKYFQRPELPVNKGCEVPKNVENMWDKIRSDLKSLCEMEALSLFNPYVAVFKEALEGIYAQSSKDDILFLEELNKKARVLLDEERITVEELYYRIASRFYHYLIDEFQDTSRLQWNNLSKMVEEALSTGGSLFYVGDRKQAIYGFRGGQVELFDEIKEEFSSFNVKTELLSKNWRSHKQIVEFNNSIFSQENLEAFMISFQKKLDDDSIRAFSDADMNEIKEIFKSAQQSFEPQKDKGYVRVEVVDANNRDERDTFTQPKIIELIKELKTRYSYSDIAILSRGNSEVEEMTRWLIEEGIPVKSERTSDVKGHYLIQELILFLKFMNSPVDNLSFASFTLGDIFTKATGIPTEELHTFIFNLRKEHEGQSNFYLYTAFRKKYPKIWDEKLAEFFKNVGLFPLYELVVSIYYRYDILKNFPSAQGFLMHFLELIKKQEEEFADIASFIEYFENLEGEDSFVSLADSDSISILTIHKSKGLEFPVCIIPFLEMDVVVGSHGSDNQQSYVLEREEESLRLLRLKKAYTPFSENLAAIYAAQYKKSFIAELNNIYVALTRAKDELYLFLPKKKGNGENPILNLFPQDIKEYGIKSRDSAYFSIKVGAVPTFGLPQSTHQDWIQYLKDEFLDAQELENKEERIRGEILHQVLSLLGNMHKKNLKEEIRKAIETAESIFGMWHPWEEYAQRVTKIIEHELLNPFFVQERGTFVAEKEIVTLKGQTKRIDSLIIFEKEVWIIDYKTGLEKEEYTLQVKEYMDLGKALYPGKKIKGYVLYLDQLKLKEIK